MRPLALLAIPALLAVAGCAPPAAEQAELCAVLALPGVPGVDRIGDARTYADLDRRLQAEGRIYAPGLRLDPPVRSLGHCDKRAATVEMLLTDGTFAMTKGGPRQGGRPTAFGTCYYRKANAGWRLLACRINDGL